MRVLIANRGEIARRIIRTAHRLGHSTVAVYADPDADAPFVHEASTAVRLGPAALAESYLSVDALVAAARASGADAVHPGYGFLSENAAFARAVLGAGLSWVGPSPDVIDRMGSKIDARRLATSAGVPVIPGFDESQDTDDLRAAAERIGYPILVKAAAGGGGKGIRIAAAPDQFDAALYEAMTEAERSFGDDRVIVERYIEQPRHVEVQVVGDGHGHVIHLGTRECSVQRRYQKLFEEAPAPNLPQGTRSGLETAAVNLARSIGYDSAGTVEFVVDHASGAYFFLEMNTRLQVEHPVTEAITGLDLVELQLRIAGDEPFPLEQDDVAFEGHAMEARINAEDPAQGFAPQLGTVSWVQLPTGVRWDSGVVAGSVITPHYDSMIAKLIVHGPGRADARRAMARALDGLLLGGVTTNTGFHRWLVDQPAFVDAELTTRFLDEHDMPDPAPLFDRALAAAARAWIQRRDTSGDSGPWGRLTDVRFTPHRPRRTVALAAGGQVHEVAHEPNDGSDGPSHVDSDGRHVIVNVDGSSYSFDVLTRSEAWTPAAAIGHGPARSLTAPFPAVVTEVAVAAGDAVDGGDAVVVVEAMKMLHTLRASGPGVVEEVRVAVGDQVESNQVLVTFEAPPESEQEAAQ